jgi:hypothetical protein
VIVQGYVELQKRSKKKKETSCNGGNTKHLSFNSKRASE